MKNYDIWVFAIAGILLFSIIIAIISSNSAADKLPVYTGDDDVSEVNITPEKEKPDIDTDIYVDNETGFSLSIPSDWREVNQDGHPTFIHTPSGASVQIQVTPYDPVMNNASAERYGQILETEGYVFKNFVWKSLTNFELLYQDYQENTYDYIEEVYWDRDTKVSLVCIFKDAYYQQLQPYYDLIISSFAWDMHNPVPEGFGLYYDENLRYEIGVPAEWIMADTDGAACMRDEATGSEILIRATEYEGDFSGMTSADVAGFVSAGRENYMMGDCSIQPTSVMAFSTYTSGDIQYQSTDALFCNGSYIFSVTCSYENGMIDPAIFDVCLGLFRIF